VCRIFTTQTLGKQLPAQTSMKRNVYANFVAQIYVMAIGFVMAPIYLRYMGTEAYGLIGFFTMMSAWVQLLDMGLTATLVRETARFRGGAISISTLGAFLRVLEAIFGALSVVGAAVLLLCADLIATHWLKVQHLPLAEVSNAVMLMGLSVPLRWISGLYRGVVNGFERQVWLSGYNIFFATLRFVGVLSVFALMGATPVHFFAYQLLVALLEVCGLAAMTYRLIARGAAPKEKFSLKPLMGNLTFSLIIAFSSTVWVAVTQTDKLILSKVLPLAEYGMFSIAVVAAGAINAVGSPFSQAMLPRLTKLIAEQDEAEADRLYVRSTQAVCMLVAPAVAVLCLFAEPILRAWTGNPEIARYGAPVLALYAVGNGFVALAGFPYDMQYAKGDLRLHFVGTALTLVLLVPLFVLGAVYYGGPGTGAAWAAINGLYVLAWVPVIHARVFKGRHWQWMMRDVVPIVAPTVLVGWFLASIITFPTDRWAGLAFTVVLGCMLQAIAICGSSIVRNRVMRYFST
jgi:O-antigen/teichoic acid export membrane protein